MEVSNLLFESLSLYRRHSQSKIMSLNKRHIEKRFKSMLQIVQSSVSEELDSYICALWGYNGYSVEAKITFAQATFIQNPENRNFTFLSSFEEETYADSTSPLCVNFINLAQRCHNTLSSNVLYTCSSMLCTTWNA